MESKDYLIMLLAVVLAVVLSKFDLRGGSCKQEQDLIQTKNIQYEHLLTQKRDMELQRDSFKEKLKHTQKKLEKCTRRSNNLIEEKNKLSKDLESADRDLERTLEYLDRCDLAIEECQAELDGHGQLASVNVNLLGGYLNLRGSLSNPLSSYRKQLQSQKRKGLSFDKEKKKNN